MAMALRLTAKFITTAEAAERIGTTVRHVQKLCKEGRVAGAARFGGVWMVPSTFRWKSRKRGPKSKGKR
jgi:excisionase family DNA binding protein